MNLIDRNLLGENITNGMVHWEDIMNTPTVDVNEVLVEELEKIKAEIMATGNWKSEYEISDRGVIKAVEVIDNHISELKGENK